MHDEEHLREVAEQHDHPLEAHAVDQVEIAVRSILESVGEDPGRDGLKNTPTRVARMSEELLQGYHTDSVALINGALFEVDYDEMVVVKNIEYYSLCEHHLLPFYGVAHLIRHSSPIIAIT